MAINVSTNFNLGAALPLDSRAVVQTKSELDAIATKYSGMLVYVTGEGQFYTYDGEAWKGLVEASGKGAIGVVFDITNNSGELIDLGAYASVTDAPKLITIVGNPPSHTAIGTSQIVLPAVLMASYIGTTFSIQNFSTADVSVGMASGAEAIWVVDSKTITSFTYTGDGGGSSNYTVSVVADFNDITKVEASGANGNIKINDEEKTVYAHPAYTARTGVPTANQTPAFGGTFNVTQPVSDATGHITAMNTRTVTIPSTAATASAAGLMSAADKSKLDGIATGATKITVDSYLSSSSANPVQNKAVQAALESVKTDMSNLLAANDAMVFKGVITSANGATLYNGSVKFEVGWTYKVGEKFTYQYGRSAYVDLEVGDMLIAVKDYDDTLAGDNDLLIPEYMNVIQTNINADDFAAAEDVLYTNATGTTVAVGGIAKGSTFENKSLKDIINDLLYPYVKPSVTLSSSTSKVFEKGTTLTAAMSVTVTAGSKAVTSVGLYSGSTSLKTLTAQAGTQSANVSLTATTTVTAKAGDGDNTVTSSGVTFTAVDPFYFGVVASAPTASAAVTALTKSVTGKQKHQHTFTTTAAAPRYCFCYPAAHGDLASILDGNGFDNTADFTKTTVNVTTAASESVSYNVYTYNNDVTAGSMAFTFSF